MRYYIDTEFNEGIKKEKFPISLFRKEGPPTIELISIGIVCEDGREYSAVSKEFDLKEAWNKDDGWLRENVVRPIFEDFFMKLHGVIPEEHSFTFDATERLIEIFGKSRGNIAAEIEKFCSGSPEFYAYYADYDWVVFCWLFGSMINLPKHFPMYCKDLKQIMDDLGSTSELKAHPDYPSNLGEHIALTDAYWNKALHAFLLGYTPF